MLALVKVMADGPQVAAVGAEDEQLGRKVLQVTVEPLRRPDRPSWALRATPRGSGGPPESGPSGRVEKLSRSPVAPTV